MNDEDRDELRRIVALGGELRGRRLVRDGHEHGSMFDRGWAYDERLERLLKLERLRALARRRGQPVAPSLAELRDSGDRLAYAARLAELETLRDYASAQRRQRQVCEALGLPWPPPDPTGRLPWRWCHERDERDLPVVYPADWRPSVQRDQFGCGDRWTLGEVLVVHDAERPTEPTKPTEPVSPPEPEPPEVDDQLEDDEDDEPTNVVRLETPHERMQRLRDEGARRAGFVIDGDGPMARPRPFGLPLPDPFGPGAA